jgi:NAD(P)-dependent dehydrogenase (short-subunit alcohol dehydrogenase family)
MEVGIAKTYVVTGATSGIGLAIMEQLLDKGAQVIGVARSPERCAFQLARLRAEHAQGRMAYCLADLSIQSEIRGVAQEIGCVLSEWEVDSLDGLVNNAGTFTFWQILTPEGFETQWAVNHLAPFLLTHEMLPLLARSEDARVITVSSGSHYGAKLNWADIQLQERYHPLHAYKQTKLANVLFTAELNRRLGDSSPVCAVAADPGLVNTDIGEKARSRLVQWIWSRRRRHGILPEKAAAGIVGLLFEPTVRETDCIYWKQGRPKRPNAYALDEDHGWRLWEISARMTGVS